MIEKVLVAGAGIGGLTAACCLLQAGFGVEVFGQAAALGETGAGVQVSANAMHALNGLGLGDAELSVRPAAYVFRLHDTGEVLSQLPAGSQACRAAWRGLAVRRRLPRRGRHPGRGGRRQVDGPCADRRGRQGGLHRRCGSAA